MLVEELKEQEAKRNQEEMEKNKKYLEEIMPKFEEELKQLCEKYKVTIEGFLTLSDMGIVPQIRIRPIKPLANPYDRK